MQKAILDTLVSMRACGEAMGWVKTRKGTFQSAWKSCQRPEWMLWLLGRTIKTAEERKKLVLVACDCAREVLQFVPKGEDRPLKAIELAERWARGDTSITYQQLREAARAARNAAAYAAAADAAYAAADAAAYAADAAAYGVADADAAYAADVAADAADAAAYVADAYAYAARLKMKKRCAAIVRQYFPKAPIDVRRRKPDMGCCGQVNDHLPDCPNRVV